MTESQNNQLRDITRRHFFSQCGVGVGGMALASLLGKPAAAADDKAKAANPMAPRPTHFPPRAKNVIFLFMAGGPSQLELFDHKPKLVELHGQPIPDSYMKDRRFAFMDNFTKKPPALIGCSRKFKQHGKSGAWVSELFPHIATVVDEMTICTTVKTDLFNHAPAKLFMNTGSGQFGRPSMGAWVTYGIGSESQNLPGFVVLQSGKRGPRGGCVNWGSGFLPTSYQGVPLRSSGEPILNLTSPKGVTPELQRQSIDCIRDLNSRRLADTGDPEITTRINQYEMAFKMQSSAPDLIDLKSESPETLKLYGAEPGKASFANNCLLARRLVERGVRFVQLYHTDWDSHGGAGEDLGRTFDKLCQQVDQGCAALVQDLKARGMLNDTLVIWGGEFGRTPMGEPRETVGRNHHIDCSTMWMAGGGIKAGQTLGKTDELGFSCVEDTVHVHDLHATILHLLGLEHTKLTYRFQGRDFRLTDVHGHIVKKLLA